MNLVNEGTITADFSAGANEQAIVAASLGPNAAVISEVLEQQLQVKVSAPTVEAVSEAIRTESTLVVLTEEVLTDPDTAQQLGEHLNQQPDWSDIPVIILLSECKKFADCLDLLGQTTHQRSVLLLELPLTRSTFSSIISTCLQNRRRQYNLRNTLRRLKESNQTLESFGHTTAHELRNPLGVLKSSFDLLARTSLTEKQTKFVEMGQRTAAGMNQTLGALLDYGKVRSTQSFEPVEMATIVSEALTSLQTIIFDRQVTIVQSDLPVVYGNRQLLVQLLSNLIKNAIVHNDVKDLKIAISAQPERDQRITFFISDNGAGIPKQAQEDIFEMFNRAGKSRTDGSGIGLAFCRRVVEQHQGSIHVHSGEGAGCTFSFDLPDANTSSVGS